MAISPPKKRSNDLCGVQNIGIKLPNRAKRSDNYIYPLIFPKCCNIKTDRTMIRLSQTIKYCFVLMSIYLLSCHDSSLDINLKDSMSNRHELEKLIQHYKGDELKLEAIKFLLENMDIHGCYRSSASDSLFQYMKFFFHTHQTKNGNYHRKGCDSLFYNYFCRFLALLNLEC